MDLLEIVKNEKSDLEKIKKLKTFCEVDLGKKLGTEKQRKKGGKTTKKRWKKNRRDAQTFERFSVVS